MSWTEKLVLEHENYRMFEHRNKKEFPEKAALARRTDLMVAENTPRIDNRAFHFANRPNTLELGL